jgi:hypothetical protein
MPGKYIAPGAFPPSEENEMFKPEDGAKNAGQFVGKLNNIPNGLNNRHHVKFIGTQPRLDFPDLVVDTRAMTKFEPGSTPIIAKCRLIILSPQPQYVDITLRMAPMWRIGTTFPEAELQNGYRVKWSGHVLPGGVIKAISAEPACTSLYYELLQVAEVLLILLTDPFYQTKPEFIKPFHIHHTT